MYRDGLEVLRSPWTPHRSVAEVVADSLPCAVVEGLAREAAEMFLALIRHGGIAVSVVEEWRQAPPLLVDPTERDRVAAAAAAEIREGAEHYVAEHGLPPIEGDADANRLAVVVAIACAEAHIVADD